MNYLIEPKNSKSITYEDVINDERLNYLLGENNTETNPILSINLYYLAPEITVDLTNPCVYLNSLKLHTKTQCIQKGMYKDIDGTLKRKCFGYKEKIQEMFDSCASRKERLYHKLFPDKELGVPIIYAFSICG